MLLLVRPRVPCVGGQVRVFLEPGPEHAWRLYQGTTCLGKAGPGETIACTFAQAGIAFLRTGLVNGEGDEVAGPSLELQVFERMIQKELWRCVLSEGPSDERTAARQEDVCRRWPGGAAAFERERERQRRCRDRIIEASTDPSRRAAYLRSRPLTKVPVRDRGDLLDEACAHALQAGYQLDPPEHFENWFCGIRRARVASYFRRRPPLPDSNRAENAAAKKVTAPPEGEEFEDDAPFPKVRRFRYALDLPDGPGEIVTGAAFDELCEKLSLEAEDHRATRHFLDGLENVTERLVDFHAWTFGQQRHLARLGRDSPWGPAAGQCYRLMETITRLLEQDAPAPLVKAVGECLGEFSRLRGETGRRPCRACGDFLHRFLDRLTAVRLLAPCWRLAARLGGPPCLWPSQAGDVQAFLTFLEEGGWRNNLAAGRPRTKHFSDTWRGQIEGNGHGAGDPGNVRLLLLWLHLLVDCKKDRAGRDQKEVCVHYVDQEWWQSRLTGTGTAKADREVEVLYEKFIKKGGRD
jgi:hypothetical protein